MELKFDRKMSANLTAKWVRIWPQVELKFHREFEHKMSANFGCKISANFTENVTAIKREYIPLAVDTQHMYAIFKSLFNLFLDFLLLSAQLPIDCLSTLATQWQIEIKPSPFVNFLANTLSRWANTDNKFGPKSYFRSINRQKMRLKDAFFRRLSHVKTRQKNAFFV